MAQLSDDILLYILVYKTEISQLFLELLEEFQGLSETCWHFYRKFVDIVRQTLYLFFFVFAKVWARAYWQFGSPYVFSDFGSTISKNNYKKPATEVGIEKDTLIFQTYRLNMSPNSNIVFNDNLQKWERPKAPSIYSYSHK